jgi:hypothetical protein
MEGQTEHQQKDIAACQSDSAQRNKLKIPLSFGRPRSREGDAEKSSVRACRFGMDFGRARLRLNSNLANSCYLILWFRN